MSSLILHAFKSVFVFLAIAVVVGRGITASVCATAKLEVNNFQNSELHFYNTP